MWTTVLMSASPAAALIAQLLLVSFLRTTDRRSNRLSLKTRSKPQDKEKALLREAERVRQPALAACQTEQVDQRRLQLLVGEHLRGFQIRSHRMMPRFERHAPAQPSVLKRTLASRMTDSARLSTIARSGRRFAQKN